jgi:formylglycine-generating enzyme required for sulfatase activity
MLGNVWEWVSGRAEGEGPKPPQKGKMSAKEKEELANQVIVLPVIRHVSATNSILLEGISVIT